MPAKPASVPAAPVSQDKNILAPVTFSRSSSPVIDGQEFDGARDFRRQGCDDPLQSLADDPRKKPIHPEQMQGNPFLTGGE